MPWIVDPQLTLDNASIVKVSRGPGGGLENSYNIVFAITYSWK